MCSGLLHLLQCERKHFVGVEISDLMLIDHSAIKDWTQRYRQSLPTSHVPADGLARFGVFGFVFYFFPLGGGRAKRKENFCIL